MHVPRPLFELRNFVFVLQYNFKKAFNSDINNKWKLTVLLIVNLKDFAEAPNNNDTYISLLTITG